MRLIELLIAGGALSSAVRGDKHPGDDEDSCRYGKDKLYPMGLELRHSVLGDTRRIVVRSIARLRVGDGDADRAVGMKDRSFCRSVLKRLRCHGGHYSKSRRG